MQRTLIFVVQKSVSVGLQPLQTLLRCKKPFKASRACSVFSCSEPVGVLSYSGEFPQFSSVYHTRRLLQNSPLRFYSEKPDMADQRFLVEYAKRGTAGCKKCKDKIQKGIVRIGKVVPNPFSESAGEMKEWYHVKCMFEKLERARATTKKIEDITELEGWEELQDEDKELINKHVSGLFIFFFFFT